MGRNRFGVGWSFFLKCFWEVLGFSGWLGKAQVALGLWLFVFFGGFGHGF